MTVSSFAKINLGLEIVGKRPDGYHDIRTLFQTISLCDEIDFEPAPPGVIELAGDDPAHRLGPDQPHRPGRPEGPGEGRDRTAGARIAVRKSVPAGGASAGAAPMPR